MITSRIPAPARIVMLKPCCIGDVIFATPLLAALRRAFPAAQIDWAVGAMAIGALHGHPAIHRLIDTGKLANPASRPTSLIKLVRALRRGRYDLIVVPDRSRLLGIAALQAGISRRAGLDSGGRGFAYTIRVPIDPAQIRHEADIYLDVGRALGIEVSGLYVNAPPTAEALAVAEALMQEHRLAPGAFLIVHPGGGVNAGMSMTQKRWPAAHFAALADRIADATGARVVAIGLESDRPALEGLRAAIRHPLIDLSHLSHLSRPLSLGVTAALASRALLYLGNDNGVGHLAAAAGARVLMIFGPSDPRRYGPFVPPHQARYVWRPVELPPHGVSAGAPPHFDWGRDGATVDDAWASAQALLGL